MSFPLRVIRYCILLVGLCYIFPLISYGELRDEIIARVRIHTPPR